MFFALSSNYQSYGTRHLTWPVVVCGAYCDGADHIYMGMSAFPDPQNILLKSAGQRIINTL